jgi:hypothetical protein
MQVAASLTEPGCSRASIWSASTISSSAPHVVDSRIFMPFREYGAPDLRHYAAFCRGSPVPTDDSSFTFSRDVPTRRLSVRPSMVVRAQQIAGAIWDSYRRPPYGKPTGKPRVAKKLQKPRPARPRIMPVITHGRSIVMSTAYHKNLASSNGIRQGKLGRRHEALNSNPCLVVINGSASKELASPETDIHSNSTRHGIVFLPEPTDESDVPRNDLIPYLQKLRRRSRSFVPSVSSQLETIASGRPRSCRKLSPLEGRAAESCFRDSITPARQLSDMTRSAVKLASADSLNRILDGHTKATHVISRAPQPSQIWLRHSNMGGKPVREPHRKISSLTRKNKEGQDAFTAATGSWPCPSLTMTDVSQIKHQDCSLYMHCLPQKVEYLDSFGVPFI